MRKNYNFFWIKSIKEDIIELRNGWMLKENSKTIQEFHLFFYLVSVMYDCCFNQGFNKMKIISYPVVSDQTVG